MEKFDILKTLYLKYENKPHIGTILKIINWIDPYEDINNLIDNVLSFQSNTIGTFGLDLYGTILNFSRAIAVVSTNYFGFQNSNLKPFNVAPFFMGIFDNIDNIVMSNENYKLLLKGLFLSTFFDGSLYNLNKIVQTMFSYLGKCCVVRNGINNIEIVSDFEFEEWQKQLFEKNIIPIPIGISYSFRKA